PMIMAGSRSVTSRWSVRAVRSSNRSAARARNSSTRPASSPTATSWPSCGGNRRPSRTARSSDAPSRTRARMRRTSSRAIGSARLSAAWSSAASIGAPPWRRTEARRAKRPARASRRIERISGSRSAMPATARRPGSVRRYAAAPNARPANAIGRNGPTARSARHTATRAAVDRRADGGRRSRHGRTRTLQQLYEAGQHEEEEHDDRDAADHRQQQRVDHGGGDAGPELVLALELVGQATERAVEITAALAGADEAYVNRWERAAMSGERGREVVASLDVGAHAPQRGADVATYHARSGIEGAGERQPGREEGRLGAAALAAAGHVHRLVAEHG